MKLINLFLASSLILIIGFISFPSNANAESAQEYNSEEGLELYYSQFQDGEMEKELDMQENNNEVECIACIPQTPRLYHVSTIRQNDIFVKGKTGWVYTKDASTITYGTKVTKTLEFSASISATIRSKAKSQFSLKSSVSKSYSTNYTFNIYKSRGRTARVSQYADQYRKRIKVVTPHLGSPDSIYYFNAYEPIRTILGVQYSS